MKRIKAKSINAQIAYGLVEALQDYFVSKLNDLSYLNTKGDKFKTVEWFRDQGKHGGGIRYVAKNEALFNRGSVNVSQVQYDDDKSKQLASATAISSIIHPHNPHVPSVHMHISWTEMKQGKGYWRLMADLNPAIENQQAKDLFIDDIKQVAAENYEVAAKQGDKYFFIPALDRHRGITHFYLENFSTANQQADLDLAENFGKKVIDSYISIFKDSLKTQTKPNEEAYHSQLAYHTLYLFQVLTLDRGTTSGLLVHDQNDLGIMGSLPKFIDKTLLEGWLENMQTPQDQLLAAIIRVLPDDSPCLIDSDVKLDLAMAVRNHYQENPKALAQQAQGNVIPGTVDNHR